MLKFLLFFFLLPTATPVTDYELAEIMSGLSNNQKTILYQYGTLKTYGNTATADAFWIAHQTGLAPLTKQQAALIASDLLENAQLAYTVKKTSRLQALTGLFTAARLLSAAAALIATFALLMLLKRFWHHIYERILQYLTPFFRLLFSPKILRFELLLLAVAALYFGPELKDVVLRTITIHLGLAVFWVLLTSFATGKPFYKITSFSFTYKELTPKEVLVQITLPAVITILAMIRVIYQTKDPWYPFEITVSVLITLYLLPPVHRLLPKAWRLLFPFPDTLSHSKKIPASCIVLLMPLWLVLLFLPATFTVPLLVLSLLLILLLLYVSLNESFSGKSYKNYIGIQLFTVVYLCACVIAGEKSHVATLTWSGLCGIFFYVLIKYWEVPVLFGWSWKNKKALGILGMAILIWGIARLLVYFPKLFPGFSGSL
ncbi:MULTISPECIES: hypothetical protein [unclassified Flavobacterium]|uniref:hypothetical protein n=1 Tax=unclassified Flavobacterium TaxID=196869 RepID=UPI001ACA25B4|nr:MULTISPECIES: hypothetical protein [unclassified Flavobacterium]MBN9284814.1 hypothetical protein [Flavobacterium sp.]